MVTITPPGILLQGTTPTETIPTSHMEMDMEDMEHITQDYLTTGMIIQDPPTITEEKIKSK